MSQYQLTQAALLSSELDPSLAVGSGRDGWAGGAREGGESSSLLSPTSAVPGIGITGAHGQALQENVMELQGKEAEGRAGACEGPLEVGPLLSCWLSVNWGCMWKGVR